MSCADDVSQQKRHDSVFLGCGSCQKVPDLKSYHRPYLISFAALRSVSASLAMSLYPGWGVGGRIKLAGWTRKLKGSGDYDDDDNETVVVVFDCERDSVERFGAFRSMDILRLWMATGLDKVAKDFYTETEKTLSNREFKKRRVDIESELMKKVKETLKGYDLYFKPAQSETGKYDSVRYSIYKFDNATKDMTLDKSELSRASANTILDGMETTDTNQSAKAGGNHYGFNDTTGIRRWMINAGLRLHKRQLGENDPLATSNFDAAPENYEVMRNVISVDTLQSEFADTLVAAIAGLVVPVDPKRLLQRKYTRHKTGQRADFKPQTNPEYEFLESNSNFTNFTPPVKLAPRLTTGIRRDGLVPLNAYLNNYFMNNGACAFTAPFARTLCFKNLHRHFKLPKRTHFKAGDTYETYQQQALSGRLVSIEKNDLGVISVENDYHRLCGVPLLGHHGQIKATYVVKGRPPKLELFCCTAPSTFKLLSDTMQWVKDEKTGYYALQTKGTKTRYVVELELVPFSNLFAPIPLQLYEPQLLPDNIGSSVVFNGGPPDERANRFAMDTTDDDDKMDRTMGLHYVFNEFMGPGVEKKWWVSMNKLFKTRLETLNEADFTQQYNIFMVPNIIKKSGFEDDAVDKILPKYSTYDTKAASGSAEQKKNLSTDETIDYSHAGQPTLNKKDLLSILDLPKEKLALWFDPLRRVIQKENFYTIRYRTSEHPPQFVPYDESTEQIMYSDTELEAGRQGLNYVKANEFDEVAFCEELYRPAAIHAADPEDEYKDDNEHMRTTLERPHGYASAPQDDLTLAFMHQVRKAATEKAQSLFTEDNVFELVPLGESSQMRLSEKHPETKLVEFFAPGDNVLDGWAMGGTPMCLIDGLELGVAYLDKLKVSSPE